MPFSAVIGLSRSWSRPWQKLLSKRWKSITAAVAVSLALIAVTLVGQAPVRAQFFEVFSFINTSTLKRGTAERLTYTFPSTGVTLTMPRFLKNPRLFKTGGGDVLVMLRTPEDTCGLYQLSETIAPYDAGPPPHFHFDTSEWFFVTEESKFRIFGTQEAKPLKVGELPGINAPVPAMGSIELNQGGLAYSPKGTMHFWHNESTNRDDIRGFYNIWTPANGVNQWFSGINNVDRGNAPLPIPGPQATLLQTSLWGVPHDPTGSFVGRPDYRNIRGPVASTDNHLAELQDLFDRGEACYPPNGTRQS